MDKLLEGHVLEKPHNFSLDPFQGRAYIAIVYLLARFVVAVRAAQNSDGPIDRIDDVENGNVSGRFLQRIAAFRGVVALQDTFLGKALQNLGQYFCRYLISLGDLPDVDDLPFFLL
jgi:hypothetical protein